MRRLLLVAGMREAYTRIFPLGLYLPDHGWEVTLVTPPISAAMWESLSAPRHLGDRMRILEVPYPGDVFARWRRLLAVAGFRQGESLLEQVRALTGHPERTSLAERLMRWYETVVAYPDAERTWRKPALSALIRVLDGQRFDAIVSSSPFPTTHLIAAAVRRRYRLRWLADFRDPWTRNHNYPYHRVRGWFEERLERAVLATADALVAASSGYARKQEWLHRRPVTAIPVGFDPDTVNAPPAPLTAEFTLTYTGTIYPGKQDLFRVLRALRSLLDQGAIDGNRVEVRLLGPALPGLDRGVEELRLGDIVRRYGKVRRDEALRRQRESQVLLLLNWEDPAEQGVVALKAFEYLAARRPILLSGGAPGSDMERLVTDTEAGRAALSDAELERALRELYGEYRRLGQVEYHGVGERIDRYSYREGAAQFAHLLNQGL